jgi:hypothetical protein
MLPDEISCLQGRYASWTFRKKADFIRRKYTGYFNRPETGEKRVFII